MSRQVHAFQAEVKELLNLMIHSLYSKKEIFLRELISNASDAIDKLKFQALTDSSIAAEDYEIRLEPDAEKKTLQISDNGIGMNQEDLQKFLGTIAHSGTRSFLELQKQIRENPQASPELIGQFGVGFYSAFMVADRIQVNTRKMGENDGWLWESAGDGTFSIESAPRASHGTTITLFLKSPAQTESTPSAESEEESHEDFSQEWTIRSLVKKYSDFVAHPIRMKVSREEPIQDSDKKDGSSPKTQTVIEDVTLNSQKALWLRAPSEIKTEEYEEFYKHVSHDWSKPLKTIHFRAEGTLEFTALLFIPAQKPFDYEYKEYHAGLQLYVKRVFIMNHCEDLIPSYLRFMKGLVDSSDLSLNVSREMLQKDAQIAKMKKSLTGKILSALKDLLQKNRAEYEKFWAEFGATLKEALPTDFSRKEEVQNLLLYPTTHGSLTTLADYVSRMKTDQTQIFYICGEDQNKLSQSPYLEKVVERGYEVLFMTDRVDEWVMPSMSEFSGKKFQSITADTLDLSTSEAERKMEEENLQTKSETLKPVIDLFKETLKDKVKEVKLSKRLSETPVCLVTQAQQPTAYMQKLLAKMGQSVPDVKRTLEVNPDHPIFNRMKLLPKDTQTLWADILYQQALLNEGSDLPDPQKYMRQISSLMLQS